MPDGLWFLEICDSSHNMTTYDNFQTPDSFFNTVRFWGVWIRAIDNVPQNHEEPVEFAYHICRDDNGQVGSTEAYGNVALTGALVHAYIGYGYYWPTYQYEFEITPACTLSTGWLSVYRNEPDGGDLVFAFFVSEEGDQRAFHNLAGEYSESTIDIACCLGINVPGANDLTISFNHISNAINIDFTMLVPGYWTIYRSLSPGSIYPSGYDYLGHFYASQSGDAHAMDFELFDFAKYIVVRTDSLPDINLPVRIASP
jgi:hypothetical protein